MEGEKAGGGGEKEGERDRAVQGVKGGRKGGGEERRGGGREEVRRRREGWRETGLYRGLREEGRKREMSRRK